MADEPTNPQQIVDEASKKLEAVPLPPTEPETIVIAPKEEKQEPPPPVVKPPKKKGGKGMLIGMLLFFILTLPVAIYYGSQKYQQITELRSRAAIVSEIFCVPAAIECTEAGGTIIPNGSCTNCTTPRKCCKISVSVTNTPTPRPAAPSCNTGNCYNDCICKNFAPEDCRDACPTATATPTTAPVSSTKKCCHKYNTTYSINTCTGASQNACTINENYCVWSTSGTCPATIPTPAGGGGGNTPTLTPTNQPGNTNTPVPIATNTPAPTNTSAPTATPTIVNTSAPGRCDASCDFDSNCESGLSCVTSLGVKRCRKAACPDRTNCECPIAEATALPTERVVYVQQPPRERVIAEAPIVTETQRPTPKVPVSGFFDIKAIIITVGSVLLLVLGLIL